MEDFVATAQVSQKSLKNTSSQKWVALVLYAAIIRPECSSRSKSLKAACTSTALVAARNRLRFTDRHSDSSLKSLSHVYQVTKFETCDTF